MSTRIIISILYVVALAMPTYVNAAKCKLTKQQINFCKAQTPRPTKKQCKVHWCDSQNVPPVNAAPVVKAGSDLAVSPVELVTLKGSATDPEGGTLVVEWTQTKGPKVILGNQADTTTTFTAPSEGGGLEFKLTATDAWGATGSDEVYIAVNERTSTKGETYYPGTQRRFAPSIVMAVSGGSSKKSIENRWNKWMEPYYRDWLDPAEKTKPGIYHAALALSRFYKGNSKPKNPEDPNDPAYDWSYFDSMLDVKPIKEGRAKFHWMMDVEGSTIPQWMRSAKLVHQVSGQKEVIDYQKDQLVKAMKEFWTAYGKRYDNDDRVYTILIDEDQSKGGINVKLWDRNKTEVYSYIPKVVKKQTIIITWNTQIIDNLVENHELGAGSSDIRMFTDSCGAKGNFPITDCNHAVFGTMQKFNSTAMNPVGGKRVPIWGSSASYGYRILGSKKAWNPPNVSNPWGEALPTSREKPKNSITNITPSMYTWYISGSPRSKQSDSKLGQNGADPAGIIPSNFVVVTLDGQRHEGETIQDWNLALRRFGAQGTKAVPALPYDWPYRGN
jgi:hypothetical protein